ncbi:MAG TPA: HD domain-containing protein [Patescibacteria group bacterium]|nr:HD domain-containing protein [Patescibacteria group bacterium]
MIPTEDQAKALWDKYALPEKKRLHVTLVTRVALFLARKSVEAGVVTDINIPLLRAAALLHDIDKAIPRLLGEQHPDTAVRVLREEEMSEVAEVVRRHPLHAIVDPTIAPRTPEEKILYLADKMVKFEILTVDKRFQLWRDEQLPREAVEMLDACYPKVKELEKQILGSIGVLPQEVTSLA